MPLFKIDNVHPIAPRESVFSLALGYQVLDAKPGGVGAELIIGDDVYGVSKLDGEDGWVIDSKWHKNLPVFANGEGSRCTLLHTIDDAAIVDALDEQAEMAAAGHDGTVVG